MRRPLLVSALLLGLAVPLVACSPPIIGTVGIERGDDGALTVLVRVCHGSVDTLTVRAINSFPTGTNGAPITDRWESVPDTRVPLTPAVAGAADVPFPAAERSLDRDVLYTLMAQGRDGNASSGLFGLAELAALQAGEVMAPTTRDDPDSDVIHDSGHGGVFIKVTSEEFEERAESFCR